jgi:hypothetical protein
MIDFEGINHAAVRAYRSVLPSLIPGGKFRGQEYVVKNPCRDDQHTGSFSINIRGVWKDFATSEGGRDFVSLAAFVRGTSQGDAALELAEKLGVPVHKPGGAAFTSRSNGTSATPAAETAVTKVHQWGREGPPVWRDELRRHVCKDNDGPNLVKIKHADGSFKQWYRVQGGWQAKKPDSFRPIPYITASINPFDPELKDDQISWPEGEKDVDTLDKLNLPAFTFGGVGDGLPEGIGHYLKDCRLIILADNDQAGREHAEKKAAVAHAAGAASIRILHFPELAPKGDVSDFIGNGGTGEQLIERIDAATAWSPPAETSQDQLASSERLSRQGWRAKVVMANDLQAMTFPPVRHILPGYISEGATIIAGKPKIGKSWLTLDLCLAATANRFTLGTLRPAQGDVLYLALEDNNRRLKRRMAKLWPSTDARWPGRLALVTDWKRADEGGLDDIEDWCRSVADPVMIVIDTLEKFRPLQNGKSAAYSADYAAVTGLQKIAGQHRIAVVVNHHVRKMEADDPFDTVSGTLGLTGAADTIIVLKRHAGAVTLHARGRDIEEAETALQFERATCRWTILGAAAEVYVSSERAAVLSALASAGPDGLAVPEIMAATGSKSRNAMDVLLFQMKSDGAVERLKRGVYAIPQDPTKIAKKERNSGQAVDDKGINLNLSNLSDLSAPAPSEHGTTQ